MTYMNTVKTFLKSHRGHTAKALSVTFSGIEHMLEHRDWDGLAMLIQQTEGRMGKQVRALVNACVGGISLQADKNHHTGMRFKLGDNFAPTEKLGVLRKLVKDQETIFSEAVQELLGKEKVKPVIKTADEVHKHIIAYANKHGYEVEDLLLRDSPSMDEKEGN